MGEVNQKQSKRARAIAHTEATRRKLWAEGEKSVYAKWWRKLAAKLFPRLRKRYADAIGRWYKRTLKTWSHNIAASIHDRELQAILAAQAKINRKYARERAQMRFAKMAAEESANRGDDSDAF